MNYFKIVKTSLDREEEVKYYRYSRWRHEYGVQSRAMMISTVLDSCKISIAKGEPCPIHGDQHSALVVRGFDIDSSSLCDGDSMICPGLYLIWRMIDCLAKGSKLDYTENQRDKLFVPTDH